MLPARRLLWAEIGLIFAIFFLQGAWPVPDVNEPYYLGKAIHFWISRWIEGDFFLNTADTHWVFNVTFGWLSLLMPPAAMAWTGRVLAWGGLAWAWQRLSFTVLPRRWFAVLSAALFAGGMDWFHMAGEWVIGGVEAKAFAYVFVLLGIDALVRGRWNRVWLLLGGASFFHVLVGGWSVVAAGVAWLAEGPRRPSLRSMAPALAGGLLLSLPGLVPAIRLDWHASPEIVDLAHRVYVFERLPHHLDFRGFATQNIVRFGLLIVAFGLLAKSAAAATPPVEAAGGQRRLRNFVIGALCIAATGAAVNLLAPLDPSLAAGLLRFYWYRLADVAVPLGVALFALLVIDRLLVARPRVGKVGLAVALALAIVHVGWYALHRPIPTKPRSDQWVSYVSWKLICKWIAESGQIPENARFLTPRQSQTFKWYTRRSEVATWKDLPQDAASIAQWWGRLREIHGMGSGPLGLEWRSSLTELGPKRLKELGGKYQADYLLTEAYPPLKELKLLKSNKWYAVYQLHDNGG